MNPNRPVWTTQWITYTGKIKAKHIRQGEALSWSSVSPCLDGFYQQNKTKNLTAQMCNFILVSLSSFKVSFTWNTNIASSVLLIQVVYCQNHSRLIWRDFFLVNHEFVAVRQEIRIWKIKSYIAFFKNCVYLCSSTLWLNPLRSASLTQ